MAAAHRLNRTIPVCRETLAEFATVGLARLKTARRFCSAKPQRNPTNVCAPTRGRRAQNRRDARLVRRWRSYTVCRADAIFLQIAQQANARTAAQRSHS